MKDLLLQPALFAIDKQIKKFENSDDEDEKIIYQGLIRSKDLLAKLNIQGVDIVGKSYEEFKNDLDQKKNVVFMTDDEFTEFKKAINTYRELQRNLLKMFPNDY